MPILDLDDEDLVKLVDNRWDSSEEIWNTIDKVTKKNTKVYDGTPDWLSKLPSNKPHTNANRVFVNTEAVINSMISGAPTPNVIPNREGDGAKQVAHAIEKNLSVNYDLLNTREVLRQGLRDLYFSRLLVLKVYWDKKRDNFNVKRIDPRNVRFSKDARNEDESEFAIENICTSLNNLITRFPDKKADILSKAAIDEAQLLVKNPECEYKECWVGDVLVIKYKDLILYKGKNPYWDWDGILVTQDEMKKLKFSGEYSSTVKSIKNDATEEGEEKKFVQDKRKLMMESEMGDQEESYESYLFNYFDYPRKPYIFATILNNENRPIGRTSFIEQATPLQEAVDRRKYAIDQNAEIVNGIIKVDSSVMDKGAAQALRYETQGVIWGKNVQNGVQREFGQGLPAFVFQDMTDSRQEIDNIMAATSAFRGERQGQETKAGRIALVQQSYLRLNELVQVIDYVNQEIFCWWTQLMKVFYTEEHEVKTLGQDGAVEVFKLLQDDFEDGIEVRVIPGKTLPQDKEFMYEQAQQDVQQKLISPVDYFERVGYDNPKELAINAFEFANDPAKALGIADQMQPPSPQPPQQSLSPLPSQQPLPPQPPLQQPLG